MSTKLNRLSSAAVAASIAVASLVYSPTAPADWPIDIGPKQGVVAANWLNGIELEQWVTAADWPIDIGPKQGVVAANWFNGIGQSNMW